MSMSVMVTTCIIRPIECCKTLCRFLLVTSVLIEIMHHFSLAGVFIVVHKDNNLACLYVAGKFSRGKSLRGLQHRWLVQL